MNLWTSVAPPTFAAFFRRKMPLRAVPRVAGVLVMATLLAAAPVTKISDLHPIALHDGVNSVPAFFPNGSSATIVQAWRANGNAHSYMDWLVIGPPLEGHGASVVTFNNPGQPDGDIISDAPFDGERVLASVRFARGMVNGRPGMLMFQSRLNDTSKRPLADHETATISVYLLVAPDGTPGASTFTFQRISTKTTVKRYCNAILALSQTLRIPLPIDYSGFNTANGCSSG